MTMIPNSAPMAAVYRRAHDNHLFSLPVVAWNMDDQPLVLGVNCRLTAADRTAHGALLGVWPHGWHPTPDEMATLLPDHVPGTPHPRAVHVTIRETPKGWEASRTGDNRRIAECISYAVLEQRLMVALGTVHIDAVVPMTPED
jgi:hypothetical protein